MSTEIIKVLDNICEKVGVAIDWTDANIAPLAIQAIENYCTYSIVACAIQIVIGLVLLFISYKLMKRASASVSDDCDYDVMCACAVFVIVLIIVGATLVFYHIFELTRWVFAPEFALIKEFSYLLK